MVDEYKDRLKEAMADAKVSRQQLADALGISYQAVRKVLLGESTGFELVNHNAACTFLGVHSAWLLDGTPPKSLAVGPKIAPLPHRSPSFGGAVAQDMSQARPIVELPRYKWEQLMTADLSQPFELVVEDDALAPEIFKGCIARFDSGRQPAPGRPVLVRDASGRHYLRDYQAGASGRWQAVARARGFAPLDSEADGLQLVAVMKGYDWP